MVTDKEWKQVQRVAAKQGFNAEALEAFAGLYGRDLCYIAFDPDIDQWRAGAARLQAKQQRHDANRQAWLQKRLSANGKKGAAARWDRIPSVFEHSIFGPDTPDTPESVT